MFRTKTRYILLTLSIKQIVDKLKARSWQLKAKITCLKIISRSPGETCLSTNFSPS